MGAVVKVPEYLEMLPPQAVGAGHTIFVHFERNREGYPPDCAPVFRLTPKGNVYRLYGRCVLRVCSSGHAYPPYGRRVFRT